MLKYSGKSANQGIAMGAAVVLRKQDYRIKPERIENAEASR